MIAPRSALFAGLICGLAVAVWAGGDILLGAKNDVLVRQTFATAFKGLWIAQAIALSVLVPWYSLYFAWRDIVAAVLVFILALLPLSALAWLGGAATIEVLGYGTMLLGAGAVLVLALSKALCRVMPNQMLRSVGVAGLQSLCATLALLDGLAWFPMVGR